MTVATRLLPRARTGRGFTLTAFAVTSLTTASDGGWVQVVSPRAIYSGGYTFFGYMDGSNGNVEVRSYQHSTGTVSAATVLHAALEVDTHDTPATIIRASDSKVMCFYTKHDTENKLYLRVSSSALDISAFAAEQTITPGGTTYTYSNAVQLTSEASQPIYVYLRDEQNTGATGVMVYTKSLDGGTTWSAQQAVYKKTSAQSYWVTYSRGTNRIDFAVSDGNGVTDDPVSVYHFYYQGGSYYQSDGTLITASLPFTTTDITKVYDSATAGPGWPAGIVRDDSGNLAIIYEVATHKTGGLADQYSIRYAYWNGSAWTSHAIVSSVDTGLSIVTHSALDWSAIGTAYIALPVSSVFEMNRYITDDQGATWTSTAMTSGSSSTGNIYPAPISFRSSDLRVLWPYGSYTTYLVNALGTKGGG